MNRCATDYYQTLSSQCVTGVVSSTQVKQVPLKGVPEYMCAIGKSESTRLTRLNRGPSLVFVCKNT